MRSAVKSFWEVLRFRNFLSCVSRSFFFVLGVSSLRFGGNSGDKPSNDGLLIYERLVCNIGLPRASDLLHPPCEKFRFSDPSWRYFSATILLLLFGVCLPKTCTFSRRLEETFWAFAFLLIIFCWSFALYFATELLFSLPAFDKLKPFIVFLLEWLLNEWDLLLSSFLTCNKELLFANVFITFTYWWCYCKVL